MYTKEVEVGGKILSFETGRFARQASGSVMVRYGDTMVLVAAVASPKAMEGIDFFPLQVEYREKFAAVGKFPGGFFKREGKPSEKEVLTARLIDRPIRPLFDDNYRNETQVSPTPTRSIKRTIPMLSLSVALPLHFQSLKFLSSDPSRV